MPAGRPTVYTDRTVCIPRVMLQSAAYRSLTTGAAHIVLMNFMLKRKMREKKHQRRSSAWTVENDGEIVFTYSEARRLGLPEKRFHDALDDLLDRGFIKIAKTGKGMHKRKTLYALSDGWRDWEPGSDPCHKRTTRKPTINGNKIGFQPGNELWRKRDS